MLPAPVAAQAVLLMVGAVGTMKLTARLAVGEVVTVVPPRTMLAVMATVSAVPSGVSAINVAVGMKTVT